MDPCKQWVYAKTRKKSFHHFLSLLKYCIWFNKESRVFWKWLECYELSKPSSVVGRKGCDSRKMWFCLGHLFCQDSAGKQASGMSRSIPFLRQEQTQAKPSPEKQKANREQNKTSFASFWQSSLICSSSPAPPQVKWPIKFTELSIVMQRNLRFLRLILSINQCMMLLEIVGVGSQYNEL